MRSKIQGRGRMCLCGCAPHLGPRFTLRSFLDGGHSFHLSQNSARIGKQRKGDSNRPSFMSAARSCLLFASDIPCKTKKPDHCPSSRNRHLQYRMCPPSHTPFVNSTPLKRQECGSNTVDCVRTLARTSLHMLSLWRQGVSSGGSSPPTHRVCRTSYGSCMESQVACVNTMLERY